MGLKIRNILSGYPILPGAMVLLLNQTNFLNKIKLSITSYWVFILHKNMGNHSKNFGKALLLRINEIYSMENYSKYQYFFKGDWIILADFLAFCTIFWHFVQRRPQLL